MNECSLVPWSTIIILCMNMIMDTLMLFIIKEQPLNVCLKSTKLAQVKKSYMGNHLIILENDKTYTRTK